MFTAVIETWVMLRFCSRSCVCLRMYFFFNALQRAFGEKCSGVVLQNPNYISLNVCGAAHRSYADWLMNVPDQRQD